MIRLQSRRSAGARPRTGFAVGALGAVMIAGVTSGAPAASRAWRVQHSPDVTVSGGQLDSVSCSSADACTAVGSAVNNSGIDVTLAERWNGRKWLRQRMPKLAENPVKEFPPELTGVSCPSASFCEAVGSYQPGIGQQAVAEGWNGDRWIRQRLPVSAGPVLTQVSCVSARFCEAVGSYQAGLGTQTLALAWNGTSWRFQHTAHDPASTFFEQFSAVSCVSTTFCEAWAGGNPGNAAPERAELWDGTAWRLQRVPSTAGVTSVSCVSATFCEAVSPGTAYLWNGSGWSAQPLPSPASSSGTDERGVACVSPAFCEIAGRYATGGSVLSLAEAWNGSAWRVQSTPNPAGAASTSLNAVSCASAAACEAAGAFEVATGSNDPKALAETWNAGSWQLQHPVAPPAATYSTLYAVSCPSASFCAAVGTYDDSAGLQENLAEIWRGTSWVIQPTPSPKSPYGPASNSLYGVSCVSRDFCEAVGAGADGSIAAAWNGTSWQVQARPGTAVQPQSVSCTSVDFCMSVDGSGQVDTWNGSTWSAGASLTVLSAITAVSCVSPSFCEAVGGGELGASTPADAAVWNGSTWSDQPTPGPVSSALNGVSCTAVNACEAVGTYYNQGLEQALATSWNGSAWIMQTAADPPASQGTALNAVSCTAARSCTAVGQYQFGILQGGLYALAEVWNGEAWSLPSTPDPSTSQDFLNAVACRADRVCTAAGQADDPGGIANPLIEAGG